MTEYDDELTGALWQETQSKVIFRGHVEVQGEKKYWILVKSQNDVGKEKLELFQAAGLVHQNDNEVGSKRPDVSGPVTINGNRYKFGAWQRMTRDGKDYLSCGLQEIVEKAPF